MMSEKTKTMEEIMDEMERNYFETDKFEAIGMGEDYHFQVLSFIGEATHKLIVANTIIDSTGLDIPKEVVAELSDVISNISALKDKIRSIKE